MRFRLHSSARAGSLLILGLTLASCQGAGPAGPADAVSLSTSSVVFSIVDVQRSIQITNRGSSTVDWRLMSTSASWITVSPSTGSLGPHASAEFMVKVNRAAVSQGSHSAAIEVGVGGESHLVSITVEQGGPPVAALQPATVQLGPQDDAGIIEVLNQGGSFLNWSLSSPLPWAKLSPSSGSLAPGSATQVVITADRTGLTRGNYSGSLNLTSNGGSASATISAEVGEAAGLHLDPASLSFGLEHTQLPLRIVNDGYSALSWQAEPGVPWIGLSIASGQVGPRSSSQIFANVSRSGLPHGFHQGAIRFTSNGGSSALTVTMNAAPTGSTPSPSLGPAELQVSPDLLDFGTSQTELSLVVHNTGDQPLGWTATTGANWASVSPASGHVSPHTNALVRVTIARGGLTSGTYEIALRFDSNGGSKTATLRAMVATSSNPPSPSPSPPAPGPAPNPNPAPAPSPPKIAVTPASIDFGESASELTLQIQNQGEVALDWTAQPANGWVTLSAGSGRVGGTGFQTITVRANRSSLSTAGRYTSSLAFSSNGGSQSVSLALTIPAPPPPPPPPSGSDGLSAIDATGTKDVTDELNAYVASVPDGSVIQFPAGAKYRVEGIFRLLNRQNLTIEGNGALIFATTNGSGITPPQDMAHLWPRQRIHVEIKGGNGIVIRDLNVKGDNPLAGMDENAYVEWLEAQHGFSIAGATNVELDRVSVTDVYGDFVYIGGYASAWSRNIHIHDSRFERNGRQGIAVTMGDGVLIERNYISDTRRATFDLEPGAEAGGALNVVIRENEIGPGRLMFVAAGGIGPNVSFSVEHNILHRAMGMLVRTGTQYRRGPIRVVGNVSDGIMGGPIPGLRFFRVDGVVVRDNYQIFQESRDMTFVMTCESTGTDVRDNELPGAGRELEVLSTCPDAE